MALFSPTVLNRSLRGQTKSISDSLEYTRAKDKSAAIKSPLNKCPDAYVHISDVSRRSKLFITVDGNPVTKVQKLDSCHILQGEKGIRWGNKEQFELRFRINDPGTNRVLKISSIIVF